MTCRDIAEFAPLYLSGDLEQDQRALFDAHLAQCRNCAAQMDRQLAMDARLRDAISVLPNVTAIQQAVRARIAAERSRRWTLAAAVAASILLTVVVSYRILRPTPPARLFTDAAQDHHLEVVEHQPRRWRTDPAEIDRLAARYDLQGVVTTLAPSGYHLEHAKMCGLDGKPALHLVYTNGIQEFSVFVQRQEANVKDKTVHALNVGPERLASFQTARFETIVATDGSSGECLQFARLAAGTL